MTGVVPNVVNRHTVNDQPLIVIPDEMHCWAGSQWNRITPIGPYKGGLSVKVSSVAIEQSKIPNVVD